MPKGSEIFELRFDVLAEIGEEVMLEFSHIPQESEWLYTFNSADIRSRKAFPDKRGAKGENYFPVVGGAFIEYGQDFLQIFPRFPLGIGMAMDDKFELHLHRNPQNDDQLGLNVPINDKTPVQHQFLIRIGDIYNSSCVWRDYLSHKNPPIVFAAIKNEEELSLDLENNPDRFGDWAANTEYSLSDQNVCVYLSSLGIDGEKMYAKVINICESAKNFSLNSSSIREQVFINEKIMVSEDLEIIIENEISFEINSNSNKSAIRDTEEHEGGFITPFSFIGYQISHTCGLYHPPEDSKLARKVKKVYARSELEYSYNDEIAMIAYFVFVAISASAIGCILSIILKRRKYSRSQ